ncbi:hypothetical protein OHB26_39310 (plasmid) [Nocardia sp. NBC_01503]|uniref:hypothetical protein n=1 Tax=Nocardia sp. NBC_01503 TaxID=2975997 RepID=UPI002E7B3B02|nr:hypothetical protein [Nocardia sp. NBC_01503]WTL36728.1 hypothetical protein OHB26_39310 [Nocardia sp. NBC_01503]
MTTPESPRNTWPQRKVRLDDQRWKQVRIKLAQDEENWQGVWSCWLSGDVRCPTCALTEGTRTALPE